MPVVPWKAVLVAALVVGIVPGSALAGHSRAHRVPIERCLEAASAVKAGAYAKVEFLSVSPEGGATYEIEVRDAKGREWELMCRASTGEIYEVEQEVDSPKHALFGAAKVSESDARKTVLGLYPGKIVEVEYEIEADGSPTYELDVATDDGKEYKVEVDAVTGKIIEFAVEAWEIGVEPDEKP